MCCAHCPSSNITLPSLCCRENRMLVSPSTNVANIHSRIMMSIGLLVARMRGSVKRRCNRIEIPARQINPAMPPLIIASICLFGVDSPKLSYSQCGVSKPAACPKNRNRIPTWNRILPMRNCLLRNIWLESLFQVYCSRSKRIRLPRKNIASAT